MPRRTPVKELLKEETVASSPLRRSSRLSSSSPVPTKVMSRRNSATESSTSTPKVTRGRRSSLSQEPEPIEEKKPTSTIRTRRSSAQNEDAEPPKTRTRGSSVPKEQVEIKKTTRRRRSVSLEPGVETVGTPVKKPPSVDPVVVIELEETSKKHVGTPIKKSPSVDPVVVIEALKPIKEVEKEFETPPKPKKKLPEVSKLDLDLSVINEASITEEDAKSFDEDTSFHFELSPGNFEKTQSGPDSSFHLELSPTDFDKKQTGSDASNKENVNPKSDVEPMEVDDSILGVPSPIKSTGKSPKVKEVVRKVQEAEITNEMKKVLNEETNGIDDQKKDAETSIQDEEKETKDVQEEEASEKIVPQETVTTDGEKNTSNVVGEKVVEEQTEEVVPEKQKELVSQETEEKQSEEEADDPEKKQEESIQEVCSEKETQALRSQETSMLNEERISSQEKSFEIEVPSPKTKEDPHQTSIRDNEHAIEVVTQDEIPEAKRDSLLQTSVEDGEEKTKDVVSSQNVLETAESQEEIINKETAQDLPLVNGTHEEESAAEEEIDVVTTEDEVPHQKEAVLHVDESFNEPDKTGTSEKVSTSPDKVKSQTEDINLCDSDSLGEDSSVLLKDISYRSPVKKARKKESISDDELFAKKTKIREMFDRSIDSRYCTPLRQKEPKVEEKNSSSEEVMELSEEESVDEKINKSETSFKKRSPDKTSITIQETVKMGEDPNQSLSGRIHRVVDLFCSGIKSKADVSINVSMEYTGQLSDSEDEAKNDSIQISLTASATKDVELEPQRGSKRRKICHDESSEYEESEDEKERSSIEESSQDDEIADKAKQRRSSVVKISEDEEKETTIEERVASLKKRRSSGGQTSREDDKTKQRRSSIKESSQDDETADKAKQRRSSVVEISEDEEKGDERVASPKKRRSSIVAKETFRDERVAPAKKRRSGVDQENNESPKKRSSVVEISDESCNEKVSSAKKKTRRSTVEEIEAEEDTNMVKSAHKVSFSLEKDDKKNQRKSIDYDSPQMNSAKKLVPLTPYKSNNETSTSDEEKDPTIIEDTSEKDQQEEEESSADEDQEINLITLLSTSLNDESDANDQTWKLEEDSSSEGEDNVFTNSSPPKTRKLFRMSKYNMSQALASSDSDEPKPEPKRKKLKAAKFSATKSTKKILPQKSEVPTKSRKRRREEPTSVMKPTTGNLKKIKALRMKPSAENVSGWQVSMLP